MQQAAASSRPEHLLYLWGIVFLYFSITAMALLGASGTAGLDQAEQLLLSQSLQPGYSAQPPLYTYIVKAVFFATGPALAPLLALKAVLLSLLVGVLIALGREFRFTIQQQLVSVAGVVFIPQFIWESQRDLTHSVLATVIAAATLLQLARTRRRSTSINYAVLGALIGLGLISKYNYAIFTTALLLAVLATPGYRQVLASRRALVILPVALLVAVPHIYWLVSNFDIAASSVRKLHIEEGGPVSGLATAAVSALAFLAPLLIFSLILIPGPARPGIRENTQAEDRRLLLSLLASTLIIVAIFIMFTGVQKIKDRWYQPLLFYAPLIPAMCLSPAKAALRWFIGLGIVLALLVSAALVARTSLAGIFNRHSHPNVPYPDLVASMGDITGKPAFILAETKMLGGNARPAFPDTVIQVPGYSIDSGGLSGDGLVLCETPDCDDAEFTEWLARNYAIDAHKLEYQQVEKPYYHVPSKRKAIYFSRIHLTQSAIR
jgi:4-amino-4-deoxy-L-arabinose transferase-like glycosyltransferase